MTVIVLKEKHGTRVIQASGAGSNFGDVCVKIVKERNSLGYYEYVENEGPDRNLLNHALRGEGAAARQFLFQARRGAEYEGIESVEPEVL